MRGTMPLIWGFAQHHLRAADWLDGQFADGTHAQIARRASVIPLQPSCPGRGAALPRRCEASSGAMRGPHASRRRMGPGSAAHHFCDALRPGHESEKLPVRALTPSAAPATAGSP